MVVLAFSFRNVYRLCIQVSKTVRNNYYVICVWLTHFSMYVHSVKWVGLFVIALVGLTTIKDLWDLLGDLSLTMVSKIPVLPEKVEIGVK